MRSHVQPYAQPYAQHLDFVQRDAWHRRLAFFFVPYMPVAQDTRETITVQLPTLCTVVAQLSFGCVLRLQHIVAVRLPFQPKFTFL
jgi:hypothetical protein